jgi:hypothetical protein
MIYSNRFLQAKTTTKLLPHFKFGSEALVKVLTKHNKIEKVFPSLGLKNDIEFDKTHIIADENGKDCEMHIGFSSDGVGGIWDIGTMSVRGVSSCMHFENKHSTHLVGSMVDPFVGIIYLTDLKPTKYGISFNKRAVVRLIFAATPSLHGSLNLKHLLYIERIYTKTHNTNPMAYDNKDYFHDLIMSLFKDYIRKRIIKQDLLEYTHCQWPQLFTIPTIISSDLTENYKSFSDIQLQPYYNTNAKNSSKILKYYHNLMEKQ